MDTVDGFIYESHSYGISADGYDFFTIWIPSMSLSIDDRGDAYRTEQPVTSKAALQAQDQYLENCSNFDLNELARLTEKASLASSKVIKIPRHILDDIITLLSRRMQLEEARKALDKEISLTSKVLFSKNESV